MIVDDVKSIRKGDHVKVISRKIQKRLRSSVCEDCIEEHGNACCIGEEIRIVDTSGLPCACYGYSVDRNVHGLYTSRGESRGEVPVYWCMFGPGELILVSRADER